MPLLENQLGLIFPWFKYGSSLTPSIPHSIVFTQQMLTEYLLCTKHCPMAGDMMVGQIVPSWSSQSHRASPPPPPKKKVNEITVGLNVLWLFLCVRSKWLGLACKQGQRIIPEHEFQEVRVWGSHFKGHPTKGTEKVSPGPQIPLCYCVIFSIAPSETCKSNSPFRRWLLVSHNFSAVSYFPLRRKLQLSTWDVIPLRVYGLSTCVFLLKTFLLDNS